MVDLFAHFEELYKVAKVNMPKKQYIERLLKRLEEQRREELKHARFMIFPDKEEKALDDLTDIKEARLKIGKLYD
jgi:dephospho-CoA kinase